MDRLYESIALWEEWMDNDGISSLHSIFIICCIIIFMRNHQANWIFYAVRHEYPIWYSWKWISGGVFYFMVRIASRKELKFKSAICLFHNSIDICDSPVRAPQNGTYLSIEDVQILKANFENQPLCASNARSRGVEPSTFRPHWCLFDWKLWGVTRKIPFYQFFWMGNAFHRYFPPFKTGHFH